MGAPRSDRWSGVVSIRDPHEPVFLDQGLPDPEPTLAALQWRSRRGTRELDLILSGFLSAGYANLTPQDRRAYARLLDTPDPDLMSWLFGQAIPSDPEIAKLVQAIRTQSLPA